MIKNKNIKRNQMKLSQENIKELSIGRLDCLLRKHGHTFRTGQNKRNETLKMLRKELYKRNAENRKAEKIKAEENRLHQIEILKGMDISEETRAKWMKMYA